MLEQDFSAAAISSGTNMDLVNAAKGATENISQLVLAFDTLSAAIEGTTSPNSFAANGYFELPGGLIFNWGTGSTTTGSGSVTFSKAFPTACYGVFLTETGTASATHNNLIASSSPSTTGSDVYCDAAASLTFFYLAIGY